MPCFFCGKRVSLVRQLTDADFCSDDHRRRYQELTRMALDRLLDAGQRLGTPQPHPDAQTLPEWQPEAIAVETPRYEAPVQPSPERQPPPPEEEFARSWRPPEPEPVYVEPVEQGEPIPPEAFYFARLECEPQPQTFSPLAVDIETLEPSFNAPTTAFAPGSCGMRDALFVQEPMRRPVSREMPERSGPGSADAFHGVTHFDGLTPALDRAVPVSGCQLKAQPLLNAGPRPARMGAGVHAATEAAGRAVPRPVLARVGTSHRATAGVRPADLIRYPLPRGTGKAVQKPGEIGFLPFQGNASIGVPAHVAFGRAFLIGGPQPLACRAVNAAANRVLAPAAEFHPVPSCSCHTALRGRGVVARGEIAGVPLPLAVKRALRVIEVPAALFAGSTTMPALALGPAAELEIGGQPPVAAERPTEAPRARAMVAARRPAPVADFASVPPTALPFLRASKPAFGISAASFEAAGRAAAAKPRPGAITRAAAIDAARWPEPHAALPAFVTRRGVASVPAGGSLAGRGMPAPTRRAASAIISGAGAGFTAFEPTMPRGAAIAAARRRLDPATSAATSASKAANRSHRDAVIIEAQFGRPEKLVEIPALAVPVRVAHISAGQAAPSATPQRPVAKAFPPHPATVEFRIEAQPPACSIRFHEHIEEATYHSAPHPAGRKGSFPSKGASLEFAGLGTLLPGFAARGAVIALAFAEAATELPAARKGRPAGAKAEGKLEIRGASEVRLPDVELTLPPSAGAIGPRPLEGNAQPAPRKRSAAALTLPAFQIDCRTLFPTAPAPVASTHLVPAGTSVPLGAQRAASTLPAVKTEGWSLPVPPAALLGWTSRTGAPLVLAVSTPVRGEIAGAKVRSTARPCGWIALGPATPAIESESALLRPGALRSGTIERGAHMEAAPRKPKPASALGATSPFAAHETLLPAEGKIAAREALEITAVATVLPGFKTITAPAASSINIGFRQHSALLPEILLDATLARIAATRRIEECPANPLAGPVWRDVARPSSSATASVEIELTTPLSAVVSRIRPAGPFPLSAAELAPVTERKARPMVSRRREAEMVAFEIAAPLEPQSRELVARHTLETAVPAAGQGRTQAGTPRPATSSVVAEGSQPVELVGAQALAFAHPLPPSKFSVVAIRASNRAGKPAPAGWEAYGQESGVIEHASIQSRASGVRWPSATSFQFVKAPDGAARAGRASKADPHAAAEFAVPAVREPELAGIELSLNSSPASKIAAPVAHQDVATTRATVQLEPLERSHRHPSRLPVFHDTVEKAHMPSGFFNYVEFEDRDDDETMFCAPMCEALAVEPWIPAVDYSPRSRNLLDEPQLAPVGGGPRTGVDTPAAGLGELPFAFEIVVLGSGAQLDKMDFESIAESYSPRWRSALKSASGLFRGMMMLVCVIALGTSLTGCAGRNSSLKESIRGRAAIHMEHDFSRGLDGWYGADGWDKSWSNNPSGFVGAGQLALYRPSHTLSDYHFQFLGQINGRAIGWAFRAADLQNYYATQLTITKTNSQPEVTLVRYQVVGGQESERVRIPLHVSLQSGQPIRIEEDVAGSGFTTSVEGEVVDSWTDDRLRAGGIGFFGGQGDKPSLYWIKVSNNDDFWGRVCGMLAPNN